MKRLIVCGDSFMSPRINHVGKHFSEIFANEFNYQLTSYARSSMSNGGIALQLLQAIEEKPNFILLNLTYPDRIEFPLKDTIDTNITWDDLSYDFSTNDTSTSTRKKGNLISENLTTLLEKSYYNNLKQAAVKLYVNELYSFQWKSKVDSMMMYAVLHKLHLSGIDYFLCKDTLGIEQQFDSLYWLTDKTDLRQLLNSYFDNPLDCPDPGFHTNYATQKQIADCVIQHYNKYFTN